MQRPLEASDARSRADDFGAQLLSVLLAYVLGNALVSAVPPMARLDSKIVYLGIGLGVVAVGVAIWRRSLQSLRFIALYSVGLASTTVGIGYMGYMTLQEPRWLLSYPALWCVAYAAVGLTSLAVLKRS